MNQLSPYLQDLQPTVAQLNHNSNPNQLSPVDLGLASFVVTFPVLLIIAISGYRNYRDRLLRSQILMLERMWQLKTQEHR
jgi:hypothetical protein